MTQRLPMTLRLFLFAILLAGSTSFGLADLTPDVQTFDKEIKPLLGLYCVRCHNAKKTKGDIRIDRIDPNIVSGEHFDQWEDIREAFNSGEMPPGNQSQPSDAERELITRWLDTEFKKAKQHGATKERGNVRRLTRYELQHALEDLLHVSVKDEITALPEEGTSVETGLKNSSRLLMISGPHLESYLNVILSVTNKVKRITAFKPYAESLDIENLDTNPDQTFTRDKRKIKPPVANVQRAGKGVMVKPKGYIDLPIRSISQYMFQTIVAAKAEAACELHVSIGFTRSDIDPRQNVAELGAIEISPGDDVQTYSLSSMPEMLSRQMTRALDRPFFIRVSNRSKQPIYLEAFDYKGNVNTDLTATLVPADIALAELDDHICQSIKAFIERAFRRPATDSEFKKYYGIYQRQCANEDATAALVSTYKEILCSPNFLYIGVLGESVGDDRQNYHLAERLAFLLWCSVPDEALLNAATAGELTTPSVIASQIDRMLKDEKSRRWVEHFADQWLQTSKLFNVAVDKSYYPKFKEPLKELMRQETIEAVNDVFRNGATAVDLLDADHVFVNQTLATFYGLKRVRGSEFRKVPIEGHDNRGGLLTQATFLIGNSDGMNSHAILRGVWLAEVILNDPPPDPPKNVPPLDESIPGFDTMTLNQKLFAHRNNDACKSCHQKIDPWGIPFESYDASGAWRDKVLVVSKETVQTEVPGKKRKRKRTVIQKNFVGIDRQATLPDKVSVNGIAELKNYLAIHRKRDFAKGLTEKILAYALSRDIDYHDEDIVERLVDRFEENDYSVPLLIRDIVQSEQFR